MLASFERNLGDHQARATAKLVRIASYPHPSAATNPYLRLYYDALKVHGYEVFPKFEYNQEFLRQHAGQFQAIHIHWNHSFLWDWGGSSLPARVRGFLGYWKFFRLVRKLGIKVLWTVHDLDHLDRPAWIDQWGNRFLAQSSDLCICHNEACQNELIKRYGVPRQKIVVMEIGNYDGVFPVPGPREKTMLGQGLDPARPTMVLCGLLRPYKGIELAIETFKDLGPEYQLLVAGPTSEDAYALQLQNQAAGAGNIRIISRLLSDQEFADLVHAGDGVLLPYHRITGSAALLTAFTLSRGVVATDLPFFKDYLQDHPEAGVLFSTGNKDHLITAIKRFYEISPQRRGQAARDLADQKAWSRVILPVADHLQNL